MHVVHVNCFRDRQQREPAELMAAWSTMVEVPRAVRDCGISVTVVQAAHRDLQLTQDGIDFHFASEPPNRVIPERIRSLELTRPRRLAELTAKLKPDVIHFNGLRFPFQLTHFRRRLPDTPILVQDHASRLPGRLNRWLWRSAFQRVQGFAFCGRDLAEPFRRHGVIPGDLPIFEVNESSTHFTTGDQREAQRVTGLSGDPCLLWIGRLDENKDPLTVLDAVSRASIELPGIRLWMCYTDAPLLAEVQQRIAGDARLAGRVELLGRVDHARVESLCRSADFFVLGSHYEGSGYATIEAMACGATPLITDIPSFRFLTGNGSHGSLVPVGDAGGFHRAILEWSARRSEDLRHAARHQFDKTLSFPAIGDQLRHAYDAISLPARKRFRAEWHPTADDPTVRSAKHEHGSNAKQPRRRIALVVPGGVDRSLTERVIPRLLWFIERVAKRHELHVIALQQEPQASTYPLLGATVHNLGTTSERFAGIRVPGLRLWRQWRKVARIERESGGWDLVHAFWAGTTGWLATRIARRSRVPSVVTICGGELVWIPEIGYGAQRSRLSQRFVATTIRRASVLTVASGYVQSILSSWNRIAVEVPLGVDDSCFRSRIPRTNCASQFRLLHVGSLNRVKDQRTLIRALAQVIEVIPNVHLDIIGEDTLDGSLQQFATELGVERNCTFHGFLPNEEVRHFFQQADLFVMSSLHESGPIAVLEASACGVPTVGTRVGHLADWDDTVGLAVQVGAHNQLGESMITLLQDERRRIELGQRAQTWARRHDADWTAEVFLRIYESLINGKSAPIDVRELTVASDCDDSYQPTRAA